ncbi:uncharacterized protein EAE98_001602 [Botrytis deweyae]|uniref:Piwi domain-containing protein n=1 Tax=Botrytis deweyae TaxID=2478750 RepID=A0ABQ7IYJ1_9HELO|nr:uncharacterized protein EAE98_001602 [Botrytis deweyae]KAF7937288.1 hypothetical protein EAE98_001602 [Botrytis deweyae]
MASSESAGSGNNGLLRVRLLNVQEAPRLSQAEQKIRNDAMQSLDLQKAWEEGPEGNEFIQANCFSVRPSQALVDKKIRIRRYKIIFGKLQLPLRNREDVRDLFEEILKQHKPQSTSWTSDYYSCIISTDPLYSECSDEPGSAISIGHEQTIQLNDRKQTIKMTSTLYFEGFFDIDSLRSYLRPRRASTQQSSDTSLSRQDGNYLPLEDLRALNLISWDIINSSSFKGGRVGKKFYPHCNPRRIVNRSNTRFIPPQHYVYDIHMGFFTSMLPGPQSILLNVNTTTTAFFPSKMNLQTWLDARWGHSSSYTGVAPRTGKNEIKGVQVTFDLDQVPRKYIISDVHDLCVFKANSGVSPQNDSSKSVWKDMQSCYPGSAHKFSKTASCVNVGNSSHPKLLPADHLRICEWQTVHGKLDNLFTAQMLGFAKKTPFENEQEIMNKALIPLGIKPPVSQIVPWKSPYEKYGLTVERKLLNVSSRHLAHPSLTFRPGKTKKLISASWNLSDVKEFNLAQKYSELRIICVTREENISDEQKKIVSKFAEALATQLKGHGLQTQSFKGNVPTVAWPKVNEEKKPFKTAAERREVVNGLLTTCLKRGNVTRLVFVILPDKDAAIYSDIKWWGDCNLGIATICVCPPAVRNKSSGILDNLSLKANFKLGGTNHIIGDVKEPSKLIRSIRNDSLMIVGADVSHPGKGLDPECPSIAGVVASFDSKFCHFAASARLQPNNEEEENEGNLPLNILFYRDGVSESQFGMVLTQELPQIDKACKEFMEKQGKSDVRVTLLVVTKRHHTRFFPLNLNKNTENISGGLVVDKHIVNPNQMSFFLQSHDSPLGTARSAHYTVIANQCKLTLDQLEQVTHKLCFVGSRALKGLSVCVPARYADILCDRLRCYMKPALDGGLRHTQDQMQKSKDPLAHYHGAQQAWICPGTKQTNPWHCNLNNIMFYL